jgi:hypothetical protein
MRASENVRVGQGRPVFERGSGGSIAEPFADGRYG